MTTVQTGVGGIHQHRQKKGGDDPENPVCFGNRHGNTMACCQTFIKETARRDNVDLLAVMRLVIADNSSRLHTC
jgi:hypothetical protein